MKLKSIIKRICGISKKLLCKVLTGRTSKLLPSVERANELHLLFEVEQPFNDLYEKGMTLSGTPERGTKRRARFYNLVNFLKTVNHLEGAIIECGCWKGLSSYLICHYLKQMDSRFDGSSYHIVDSFEGLSEPSPNDIIKTSLIDTKKGERKGSYFKTAGAYSAQMTEVKAVLSDFPSVSYHQGWIPQCLNDLPNMNAKLVHIDVDLYEPILGALNYFYPKMVRGGIIVCDDYGSLYWPGAQKAVEEFAEKNNLKFISLSSGQAVFIKQ